MATFSEVIRTVLKEDFDRIATERANDPQAQAREAEMRKTLQAHWDKIRATKGQQEV